MEPLTLDSRLENDCLILGYLDESLVLLMNNSQIPWLILVPDTSSAASADEFDLLSREQQIILLDQINLLSAFLRKYFQFDKLNIATIGNVVRQLHIHIVARSVNDYCWPGIVWGQDNQSQWTAGEVDNIRQQLATYLPGKFKKCNNARNR